MLTFMIRPLRYALLATSCGFVLSASAALAFNPNEGADSPAPSNVKVLTASASPLYAPGTISPSAGSSYASPLSPLQMPSKPLYPTRTGVVPPMPVAAPVAMAPAPAVIAPAPAIARAPMVASVAPALPPVDPVVEAKAQAILAAEHAPVAPQPIVIASAEPKAIAQPLAAPASGFIAPIPALAAAPAPARVEPVAIAEPAKPIVMAQATPAMAPAVIAPAPVMAPAAPVTPEPLATPLAAQPTALPYVAASEAVPVRVPAAAPAPIGAPVVADAAPAKELSDESRTILSHVPSQLDKSKPVGAPVKMDRISPEIKEVLGHKADEETFESVGLSIKVRRPGLDTNYELNRAYNALMAGDTTAAIEVYKNILSVEPRNEDALFGLAATYHRTGQVDKARPIYGMLLQVNPNHREGLNNFLVLVSDESPEDALPELQRLEERNPEFSPIPAQIAIVLDKMGYVNDARDKMLRAMELSPENMTYKYNLAVMLDRQKQYADAAALYKELIDASLHGATVPASTEIMQKRLTYLVTEMTTTRTGMAR